MIVLSGKTIFPLRVGALLMACSSVAAAAEVVGVAESSSLALLAAACRGSKHLLSWNCRRDGDAHE